MILRLRGQLNDPREPRLNRCSKGQAVRPANISDLKLNVSHRTKNRREYISLNGTIKQRQKSLDTGQPTIETPIALQHLDRIGIGKRRRGFLHNRNTFSLERPYFVLNVGHDRSTVAARSCRKYKN